jgi:hypothetical protein
LFNIAKIRRISSRPNFSSQKPAAVNNWHESAILMLDEFEHTLFTESRRSPGGDGKNSTAGTACNGLQGGPSGSVGHEPFVASREASR